MAIPRPGAVLRTLVTATGLRPELVEAGLEQDLDDAAREARPGANAALLDAVEWRTVALVEEDCGRAWAEIAAFLWQGTALCLRQLAAHVDTTCLPPDTAASEVETRFTMPALQQTLHGLAGAIPGPNLARWWADPFGSWVDHACTLTGVGKDRLLDGIAVAFEVDDPATVRRWLGGEPSRTLVAPYRARLATAIAVAGAAPPSEETLERLTGWLAAAVGCLSMPAALRSRLQERWTPRRDEAWSMDETVRQLSSLGYDRFHEQATVEMAEQMNGLEEIVSTGKLEPGELRSLIARLEAATAGSEPEFGHACRLMEDRLRAWQAILDGDDAGALALFDDMIERAWWRAGWQVHSLIRDALLHAVGIGRQPRARHLVDRLRLLGDIDWHEGTGDAMDRRRAALAFEQRFPPRKAKERVPPTLEIVDLSTPFELSRRDLDCPDRLEKFADGRTRRTPLMKTILWGTSEQVDRLLDAGADPNVIVPESGESALTCALRRADQRRDAGPLNRLLECDLDGTTLNAPASTTRETPLELAIDLDSAEVVGRLVDLGVVADSPTEGAMPPLSRALSRLQVARQGFDEEMMQPWLEGARPDGLDAKRSGAVTRHDTARGRRESLAAMRQLPERAAIMDEVMAFHAPDLEGCRAVIVSLLERDADPNRWFRLSGHPLELWTPTLHAAQVGDLEAFALLLDHGGDPLRTLRPASAFQRLDALHLAVTAGRDAIAACLRDRMRRSG